MAYATSGELGVNYTSAYTPGSSSGYPYKNEYPPFSLGQTSRGTDGSVWTYCVLGTGGATGAGYVVTFDEDFLAVMLSTSNDVYGEKVGVVATDGDEDDYIWVQVYGVCPIRSEALALANSILGPTGDAGQIDDAAATGLYVDGMILTTAAGASDGNAPGELNYPTIQTRMTPET